MQTAALPGLDLQPPPRHRARGTRPAALVEAMRTALHLDDDDGLFTFASRTTAEPFEVNEAGQMLFHSTAIPPRGVWMVGIDKAGKIAGMVTPATFRLNATLHHGEWRLPAGFMMAVEAVIHDACSCNKCGRWPAGFSIFGEIRCGKHWRE